MKRLALAIIVIVGCALPVAAQDTATPTPTITRTPTSPAVLPTASGDCGYGLPCGPLPWRLPALPELRSPTPFPTVVYQATDTPEGPSPTPSDTPTPTPTFIEHATAIDVDDISDRLSTLEALLEQTEEPILDLDGYEVTAEPSDFEADTTTFFSYVRGITELNLGPLAPMVTFVFTGFGFVLLIKLTTFMLPLVTAIWGVIRKVIQLVLDFIPG